jgi:transcription initiation factor TFIIH subunit 4
MAASVRGTPAKGAAAGGAGAAGSSSAVGQDSINAFLDRQPQTTLSRLYQRPANCLAVFRLLPTLARQQIMALLFLDAPLPVKEASVWIRSEGRKPYEAAMARLDTLGIVRVKNEKLFISSVFCENMRRALTGG